MHCILYTYGVYTIFTYISIQIVILNLLHDNLIESLNTYTMILSTEN